MYRFLLKSFYPTYANVYLPMHLCVHYWWLQVTIFSTDIWNGKSIWLYNRNRCFNNSTNSLSVCFLLSVRHWEFSFCVVKAVHGGIVLKLSFVSYVYVCALFLEQKFSKFSVLKFPIFLPRHFGHRRHPFP